MLIKAHILLYNSLKYFDKCIFKKLNSFDFKKWLFHRLQSPKGSKVQNKNLAVIHQPPERDWIYRKKEKELRKLSYIRQGTKENRKKKKTKPYHYYPQIDETKYCSY